MKMDSARTHRFLDDFSHYINELRCDIHRLKHLRELEAKRRAHAFFIVGQAPDPLVYSLTKFDQLRCIFFHIPKTAGISVSMALFGSAGGGHLSALDYRYLFGRDFWRYWKFTFVRNPLTRVTSAYQYLLIGGHRAWPQDQDFRDEVLSHYADFEDFAIRWLTPKNAAICAHFRPQLDFLLLDGKMVADYVGRFETLQDDFGYVSSRLGVHGLLSHQNVNIRKQDYNSYLENPRVRNRIISVYEKDFEKFGYSPDN